MSKFRFKLDLSKVVAWADYQLPTPDERDAATKLLQEAEDFLRFYSWCRNIKQSYVGILVPGIIGVFLFEIEPARGDVDDWVWVVVGDVPPAYITCEDSPNPACALDAYIGAMNEWVAAASVGKSVADLIPVNVQATVENANALGKRLRFLDEMILSNLRADLSPSNPSNI